MNANAPAIATILDGRWEAKTFGRTSRTHAFETFVPTAWFEQVVIPELRKAVQKLL
jgi:hypothetical protein